MTIVIFITAEAEVAEAQMAKRVRYSTKKFDGRKDDEQDSDDNRTYNYETVHSLDMEKIKKERESDKSETDSIGMPNTAESEAEAQKADEASIRSTNSSAASSPAGNQKAKGRMIRGGSPGGTPKQKIVDMTNPAFKEPFKYGWKRELVFRASNDSSMKRMADIYYYTPKGKKVRSFREVAEFREYIL